MHLFGALQVLGAASAASAATTFHVDPAAGGDISGDGSPKLPYYSVAAARDALRLLRSATESGGATVLLHEGVHAPFALDASLDSGTPDFPIRYGAPPGANAVVSAGVQVPKSAWTAWAGHPHVLTADLAALGLSDFGALPKSGGQIDSCNQLSGGKMQLFHNASAMVLARYPNVAPDGDWRFLYVTAGTKDGFSIEKGANATRVLRWAKEEAPFVHGYWSWDWADSIQSMVGATQDASSGSVSVSLPPPQVSKKHARFFGVNLLSELDVPNEFFIDSKGKIYYYPAAPMTEWIDIPTVSVNMTAVSLDGTSHVSLENVTVAHAKGTGVSAKKVSDVVLKNCTVYGHGANGVVIEDGFRSGITDSEVYDVGCIGVTLGGGDFETLTPGLNFALRNHIHHMANFKRTYQPGLHWSGVNNTVSYNYISDGPHNCVLGGGNEGPAANCLFEYNTLDKCSYESSDTGAFYTCGQQANAFVNRGNELRHSLFKNIRNTEGSGVQGITIQAIYLDDQMSGWHIWNNTFYNCDTGTFIGGGEHNSFHDNYYQLVDTAQHFDNRGMNWQGGAWNCTQVNCHAGDQTQQTSDTPDTSPNTTAKGCTCNPAAVSAVLAGPGGAEWQAQFGAELKDVFSPPCAVAGKGAVPCFNVVENNEYCDVKKFIDATEVQTMSWHSLVSRNKEVKCRYTSEPVGPGGRR